MKVIKPSVTEITEQHLLKKVELCGRICYKSEDKITETSHKRFVEMLIKRQHLAMLEHAPVVLMVTPKVARILRNLGHGTYLNVTINNINERYIVSGTLRSWHTLFHNIDRYDSVTSDIVQACMYHMQYFLGDDYSFLFPEVSYSRVQIQKEFKLLSQEDIFNLPNVQGHEVWAHVYLTAHFVCDRGVSHELVRHRAAGFAQESTRYCNYSKDAFGNEITCIDPGLEEEAFRIWFDTAVYCEEAYFTLLEKGCTPQDARGVLPTDLKTELVMTCNLAEWQHIFNLRYHGTTGAPHPHMKQVMELWYNMVCSNKKYNIWII